jgi:hypothetical protein
MVHLWDCSYKIITMFALCLRYPGLKTPMVGGIDLVGRVLETKSVIPAQVGNGTETDAVGTGIFFSLSFESLRARIGSLVVVNYGTIADQKYILGEKKYYLNRGRDPSIRLLHISSII